MNKFEIGDIVYRKPYSEYSEETHEYSLHFDIDDGFLGVVTEKVSDDIVNVKTLAYKYEGNIRDIVQVNTKDLLKRKTGGTTGIVFRFNDSRPYPDTFTSNPLNFKENLYEELTKTAIFQNSGMLLLHNIQKIQIEPISYSSLMPFIFIEESENRIYYVVDHPKVRDYIDYEGNLLPRFEKEFDLDLMLSKADFFRTQLVAVKARAIDMSDTYIDTNVNEILGKITEARLTKLEDILERKENKIKTTLFMLEKQYEEKTDLLDKIHGIKNRMENQTEEKIIRALSNPIINTVKWASMGDAIIIETHPIILEFDHNKINSLPPETKKLLIKNENYGLGIGRHYIKIDKNLGIRFTRKDDFTNHHVENHTCFGTFSEPYIKAKEEGDLVTVIQLALRIIRYITIGDIAGSRTAREAYLVNKLTKNQVDPKTRAETDIIDFLKGKTRTSQNTETIIEELIF